MERPFSKSHQERLGERLIAGPTPDGADLAGLRELLTYYGAILEGASERIRNELGLKTTSRIKNTGTILEKLRRSGGSTLKSMQDLAGMRIVGGPDRREQDETVARVAALFRDELREPKVIDRRANPVHGYSAVHVIVFPQGVPVEVQIRTTWQHEWAEVFEKLADQIGRGIRYGEEPERQDIHVPVALRSSPSWQSAEWAASIKRAVDSDHEARTSCTDTALAIATVIADFEAARAAGAPPPVSGEPFAPVESALKQLQGLIGDLRQIDASADVIRAGLFLLAARAKRSASS